MNKGILMSGGLCKIELFSWVMVFKPLPEEQYQFLRKGYFVIDAKADGLVFKRMVTLKDAWAKEVKKG